MARTIDAAAAEIRVRVRDILRGTTFAEFRDRQMSGGSMWQFTVSSHAAMTTSWLMVVMSELPPFEYVLGTGAGLYLEPDEEELGLELLDAVVHGGYRQVVGVFGSTHEILRGMHWTPLGGKRRPRWIIEIKRYRAYE